MYIYRDIFGEKAQIKFTCINVMDFSTPFAYEVVSRRKCPSSYEWYQSQHGSLSYTDLRRHIEPH